MLTDEEAEKLKRKLACQWERNLKFAKREARDEAPPYVAPRAKTGRKISRMGAKRGQDRSRSLSACATSCV